MHVLVDDAPFKPPITGVGRYAAGLVGALAAGPYDVRFSVLNGIDLRPVGDVLSPSMCAAGSTGHIDGLASLARRFPGVMPAWRALKARAARHGRGFDFYHALNFQPAFSVDCPVLPVVHDLAHERVGHLVPHAIRRALAPLERQLRDAPLVHVVSEFTKREVVDIYGIPADRIVVVRSGVGDVAKGSGSAARDARVLERLGLEPQSYFITVGSAERRKNLSVAIEAHARLPATIRTAAPLVMVGPPAPAMDEFRQRAGKLGANVHMIGFVDDPTLDTLYRTASLLLFPSLYEGYGMPVAEALTRGTPVAAVAGTAAAEAGQGRALLLDGGDVDAWAEAMRAVIEAPGEARALASGYEPRSWDVAAAEAAELYARFSALTRHAATGSAAAPIDGKFRRISSCWL